MDNKLWILRPIHGGTMRDDPWEEWYDKVFGFVVSATSEHEARRIASENCGQEGKEPWLNPTDSTCQLLTAGSAGMIVRDFHAA